MTPEAARASHRRLIAAHGEPISIRRYTGTGTARPRFDWTGRARVMSYKPDALAGTLQQGDAKVIVLAEDLIGEQFPVPPRKNDKCVVRGRELNIEAVDDNTRRVAGVIVAYEITARG